MKPVKQNQTDSAIIKYNGMYPFVNAFHRSGHLRRLQSQLAGRLLPLSCFKKQATYQSVVPSNN
jgi:hypothetical protein